MSGISSGIGLISGINRSEIIDQLIAIESRPVTLLQNRVSGIDAQRTAFLELSAKILAVQNAVTQIGRLSLFRKFSAVSSNDGAIVATAGEQATAGSITLRPRSLVTNHALLSRGFADADRTPVGAGTLTIEQGRGRVDRGTELESLNGGAGVRRGVIRITDRAGHATDIDLTTAITVADVLDAINSNPIIDVKASVTGVASEGASGDRIVLEDLTGLDTGVLSVVDRNGGFAAQDLGIAGAAPAGRIDGRDLVQLTDRTALAALNDGNGVDRAVIGTNDDLRFVTSYGEFGVSLSDVLRPTTDLRQLNSGNGVRLGVIRVTDRSGRSAEIDLTTARTVQDVRQAIEDADVAVSVAIVNSNLQLTDTSETPAETAKNLKVEDVSGFAAADLGLAQDVASNALTGRSIYRVSTLGDVVRAINYAAGNNSFVEAAISPDGKGLTLTALGFENTVTVSGVDSSGAAADLGIAGATFTSDTQFATRRLVAGLNTVLLQSLRGGQGVSAGRVRFTDRAGQTSEIDFSSAQTLQDIVDRINADDVIGLTAEVNGAGTGILIRDESGSTAVPLAIEDVSGSLAAQLGIATASQPGLSDATSIEGGNLQLKYVSRATKLTELLGTDDVRLGEFQITDTNGATHVIGLAVNLTTVGEVIDAINLRTPDHIEVRINDTGDGIVVLDHAGGAQQLKVSDLSGGQAARDLRLSGTAAAGTNFIDGTLERRITVDADDTLQDLVGKINASGPGVTATVLNDGRSLNPFSLVLTSGVSGRRGELLIDPRGLDLGLQTLTRAQDAVVTVGAGLGVNPVVITSSSNTLEDVVAGVSLELVGPSDTDVTVTVDQDVDSIVAALSTFVSAYNDVQADIDDKTAFNQDTSERGILLGDNTVITIRDRLNRAIAQPFRQTDPAFARLFAVGIRLGANNRLEFNEQKFRDAYAANPEAVEQLFTTKTTGVGDVLKGAMEAITSDFDGLIGRRDKVLADQKESITDRIADLNVLLDRKRARLEAQFTGLENALAGLQAQQAALANLARLIPA